MIYKMELSDSVDTMVFDLLEVPIVDKDITGIAENTTIDGNVYEDYLWLKKQYVQKWSIMCQDEYDRLRGFWTRQFGNAEVPFYRLFYGSNIYEDKNFLTSDGFMQIMNPTERLAPLSLTHLYGNATQETLSGKNLLDGSNPNAESTASATMANNVITVYSSEGSDFLHTAKYDADVSTNDVVRLSAIITSSDGQIFLQVWNGSSWALVDGTQRVYTDGTTPATISYTVGSQYSKVRVLLYSNKTMTAGAVSSTYKKTILTVNNADMTYEPFVGGVPMPNPSFPSDVNVVSGLQTVRITGKNLFDGELELGYINGTTGQNASSNNLMRSKNYIPVMPNTEYTISAEDYQAGNYYYWYEYKADMSYNLSTNKAGEGTFTTEPDTAYVRFRFSTGYNDTTKKVMLVKGGQASSYEAYQSQSQEINLGKNLLHLANYTAGGVSTTLNSNGTITVSGTTANNYANFMAYQTPMPAPSGTYTFSRIGDNTYRASLTIFNRDKTQNTSINISAGNNSATAVIPFDIGYVAGAFTNLTVGSNLNFTTGLQLELGSQASSFSPYKTPIELAKIGTYQDYIWNDNGTWKIHKETAKLVFNPTNASYINQNASNPNRYLNPAGSTIFTGLALGQPSYQSFCSHYTFVRNGTAWQGIGKCGFDATGTFWLMDSTTNVSTLRAWLASEGVYIYYPLATPTDTEITESELIEQLNYIYELYQGTNNVWLIPSAGAQGEIEGTYRLIFDEETDIVPKTPVVLTLTDGGVINPCGCRQNIQLIMRETEGN